MSRQRVIPRDLNVLIADYKAGHPIPMICRDQVLSRGTLYRILDNLGLTRKRKMRATAEGYGMLSARVRVGLRNRFREAAQARGMLMPAAVEQALKDWIDRMGGR